MTALLPTNDRFIANSLRLYPNRTHHARVLVIEQMAVVRERADGGGIAKIHAQLDGRVVVHFRRPVGDVDRVAQEWLVHGNPEPIDDLEMDLVDMERVKLARMVLDDPVLDIALVCDEIWSRARGVERFWGLSLYREIEPHGAVGIRGVHRLLGEDERACACGREASDPRSSRRRTQRGARGYFGRGFGRVGPRLDRYERPVGIVLARRSRIDIPRHELRTRPLQGGVDHDFDARAGRHQDPIAPLEGALR